jgi:hypothetical protein
MQCSLTSGPLKIKGTILIRNAGNHSLALTASHHRRFEYAATSQVLLSVATSCSYTV